MPILNLHKIIVVTLSVMAGMVMSWNVSAERRQPNVVELQEVVVNKKKQKYSKKNNPAVRLMQLVRSNARKYTPLNSDWYSYDIYDKLTLGINNFQGDFTRSKTPYMQTYIDTAFYTGKRILLLSIRETLSSRIVRKSPGADKTIVTGTRHGGVDDAFDQQNVQTVLNDVLRDVDLYKNDIVLLQNRLVSPLSVIGDDFYKYEIVDTVVVDGRECVNLAFVPKNPETPGFNGNMYVEADSTGFVKRVVMRVPHAVNLNYVKNIYIAQNFKQDSLGYSHKTYSDMSVELQLFGGTPELYARRVSRYDNFSYLPHNDFSEYYDRAGRYFQLDEAETRDDDFWDAHRLEPLSGAEAAICDMMPQLRKNKLLWWLEKIAVVVEQGYVKTSKKSYFDVGPVNTLISYNSLEGLRLRLGGLTTANLNPHLFGRGYVAYGCKDRKWKYSADIEYSFDAKKKHAREWPMNCISVHHSYDVDMLGQHYLFTNTDNIVLSLKRRNSYPATYRRLSEIAYKLELRNDLSFEAEIRREQQQATRFVSFINGYGERYSHLDYGAIGIRLRFAPSERFVQGRSMRAPVNMDSPVFTISHQWMPAGWMGADFTLHRSEFSFSKRFWFSAFGYMNTLIKAGKVWSKVQFPALLWPNSNLSYTIQSESYSLMNPMEFANDAYGAIDLDYYGNGVMFNHIPGLKRLKLRELLTFKMLMGSLSKKNNPKYNNDLFRFPNGDNTYVMGKKPYMELGVGIDNIFTILRVDYVWRLTYRNHPDIDKSGVRVSLHFSF